MKVTKSQTQFNQSFSVSFSLSPHFFHSSAMGRICVRKIEKNYFQNKPFILNLSIEHHNSVCSVFCLKINHKELYISLNKIDSHTPTTIFEKILEVVATFSISIFSEDIVKINCFGNQYWNPIMRYKLCPHDLYPIHRNNFGFG